MTLQKEREVVEVAQVEEAVLGVVEEAEVEEAKVEEGMVKPMMRGDIQIHIGAEAGDMTKAMMVLAQMLELAMMAPMLVMATMLGVMATQAI